MLQHFSPFFSGAGDYSLTPLLKGKEDEEEGGYGCHFRLLCFTDEGPCCVLYVQSTLWDIDWAQSIVISTVRSSKEMREGGEKEEEETVAGSLFSSFGRSVGRREEEKVLIYGLKGTRGLSLSLPGGTSVARLAATTDFYLQLLLRSSLALVRMRISSDDDDDDLLHVEKS